MTQINADVPLEPAPADPITPDPKQVADDKRKSLRDAVTVLNAKIAALEADPTQPVPDFSTLIKVLPQGSLDALRERLDKFNADVIGIINAAQLAIEKGGDPGPLDWSDIVARLGG